MARNYPECDLIFNSTFIAEKAECSDSTVDDVQSNYSQQYGQCKYIVYTYLPDAYVYSLIACYSIILPIGFFGNLMVILTVLAVRELRIVMNLLLVAMALSDLVITMAIPFTFLNNISYNYEGSVSLCRATPLIQGTAIMSGIYTLVVIAIERYNAIVHILRPRIINSTSRVAICVGIIWLVSACFQIPLPIVLDVDSSTYLLDSETLEEMDSCPEICFNVTERICFETWSQSQALAFSYAVLVTFYIVPLLCITYLYSRIGYFLWKRRPVGNASVSELRAYRRKKRLVTFLVVLVAAFAALWGPYFVLQCVAAHVKSPILAGFIQLMGHSNVAVNPILYAYFHRRIRKHAMSFARRACVSKPIESETKHASNLAANGIKHNYVVTPNLVTHKQSDFDSGFSQNDLSTKRGSAISYDDLLRRITDLRRQSGPNTHLTPEEDLEMADNLTNKIETVPEKESLKTVSGSIAAMEPLTSLPNAVIPNA